MDNLNKSIYIYIIMMTVTLLLGRLIEVPIESYCNILIIECALMIALFIIFRMNNRGITIFMAIFTILLMMIALNSEALFNKYTEYGLYLIEPIIPFEILAIIAIIALPFMPIIMVLVDCGFMFENVYIVPAVMIVLTCVFIIICRTFDKILLTIKLHRNKNVSLK